MKLHFYGADRCVTGSCHCLEINGKKILVDCGLQQGRDELDNRYLAFAPGNIDILLVTHAHIDHTGRIPLLVKNGFQFTESDRAKRNRELVKRDNNNVFDFLESEGYIRLKADARTSSKELYEVYRMWCEENSLNAIKARGFSDALIANQRRYNLESTNNIVNSSGRRVRGFVGIEALVQPDLTLNSWRA